MALTETQKTSVRMYLGYERGADLNSTLESKLDDLSATEETRVGAAVTALDALVTRMDTLSTNGTLEALKVDEIELREGDVLEHYAAQGRRLVRRLVALLGVEPRIDFFDESGGIGGVIPLG